VLEYVLLTFLMFVLLEVVFFYSY